MNPLHLDVRGVNLGGWMVLQPWITPSLFYQFEGRPPDRTAMDMHSFCEVLGPQEGNRQLREHWRKWVTEREIRKIAEQGLNTVRVPVGDWMWLPYDPYIGCTDGALDELWRVIHLCEQYGIRVLVDLHGVRRSQNGFDNSGHIMNVTWSDDGQSFSHWPSRSAAWQGSFDPLTMTYSTINWDNIRSTVQVLQRIAISLRHFPSILGIEALNEPWQFTPLDVLKAFYWEAYWTVRAEAPHWLFVIHDSFRLEEWSGYMKGCQGVALDTHVQQAWFDIRSQQSFLENACSWRQRIRALQETSLPILVCEWSLATDNCNMWLNGFHDNAPGFPKVECGSVVCPSPQVSGIAGPPQGSSPGPRGTGSPSAPSNGRCSVSKPWDNEDAIEQQLAEHKISAFEEGVGWIFWNFRVELDPRWSWEAAYERGWLPRNVSNLPQSLLDTCKTSGESPTPSSSANDLPWYNMLPSAHGRCARVADMRLASPPCPLPSALLPLPKTVAFNEGRGKPFPSLSRSPSTRGGASPSPP
uniref:Glycoside hydrolase family 5 domain-containing protein n=1 Tax=Chrysotila carterae TaxID=13221 RepID=A0A7S4BPJ0_CHRCT